MTNPRTELADRIENDTLYWWEGPGTGLTELTEIEFNLIITALRAAPQPETASNGERSEEERHAIAHAKYMCDQASPSENPEVCFDFELVRTLLSLIPEARPYAARADSATAFDPERQFDEDQE